MPNYKLVDADKLEADLTTVANAIRGRGGASGNVSFPDGFVGGVQGINVELPELSNPATAEEVFLNKEFIDEDGNSVTGTFSIDNELSNQDNLISQIQTALQNKAAATGEDVTSETIAYTTKLATLETAITALETELQGKASGGSGGGSVETCTFEFVRQGQFIPDIAYTSVDDSGNLVGLYERVMSLESSVSFTCVKGTVVTIILPGGYIYSFGEPSNGLNSLLNVYGLGLWGISSDAGDLVTVTISGTYDT